MKNTYYNKDHRIAAGEESPLHALLMSFAAFVGVIVIMAAVILAVVFRG